MKFSRIVSVALVYAVLESGAALAAVSTVTVAQSARSTSRSTASDGSLAELVKLDRTVAEALGALEADQTVRLMSWPIAPGVKRNLRLTRYDVYAKAARMVKVEDGGETEVPHSPLRFFSGEAEEDSSMRALVIMDPRTKEVTALTETAGGAYELQRPSQRGEAQMLASRASFASSETAADMNCLTSCGPGPLQVNSPKPRSGAFPSLTTLYTATIAVETDNELMLNNFGNNTAIATDFMAQPACKGRAT